MIMIIARPGSRPPFSLLRDSWDLGQQLLRTLPWLRPSCLAGRTPCLGDIRHRPVPAVLQPGYPVSAEPGLSGRGQLDLPHDARALKGLVIDPMLAEPALPPPRKDRTSAYKKMRKNKDRPRVLHARCYRNNDKRSCANGCLWHTWTIAHSRLSDLGFCCFSRLRGGSCPQVNVFSRRRTGASFRFAAPFPQSP